MKAGLINKISVFRSFGIILIILGMIQYLSAQVGTVETWSFNPTSINSLNEISCQVYLPPNHNSQRTESYPYLIVEHGCCGSSATSMLTPYKQALDDLISSGQIAPIVAVFPNIQLSPTSLGKPDFLNHHLGLNSTYYGNFGDVITIEMIPELESNDRFNLSSQKTRRAIGGFSSGADGAMRLSAQENDLFLAMIGHSGLTTLQNLGDPTFLNSIKNEMSSPPINQTVGSFNFDYNEIPAILTSTFMTNVFLGLSALFSDTGDPIGDFVLDSFGNIRSEIMIDDWVAEHNVLSIIKNNSEYLTDPVEIYFEWASNDLFSASFNSRFLTDLEADGWVNNSSGSETKDFFHHNYTSGGHALTKVRASNALVWLNGLWGSVETSTKNKLKDAFDLKVMPNIANQLSQVRINFSPLSPDDFQFVILDANLRSVFTEHGKAHSGKNEISWNVNVIPGVYFYQLSLNNRFQTGKIIVF